MNDAARITVELGTSTYGNPEPRLMVRMPKGATYRQASAMQHRLAAAVEDATPERERWVVTIGHGMVQLELIEGDAREVGASLLVLNKVADQF